LALVGFVAAPLARWIVGRCKAPTNFVTIAVLIITGLAGAVFAIPLWGVWVILPLGLAMNLLSFFVSHYLNQWTLPTVRATVLSFRGVALNLAYGIVGVLFAGLTGRLRTVDPGRGEGAIFGEALRWIPLVFGVLITIVALAALLSRRRCRELDGGTP